jgi:nitrogen-specific signal transduction histidine kinase
MANAIYPKYKEAVIQSSANSSLTGTVRAALVDSGTYTYSTAHEFLSSLSGVVGTAQILGTKTYTNGVFDAADVTYTAVSGASAEAIVLYIDTGVAGTSRLVAYLDTGFTGLPVTPNGGDIAVTWNASGIFAL